MNTLQNISSAEIEELKGLGHLIDQNIANSNDYRRYKELLNKAGLDDETIHTKLAKYNVKDLDEYFKKRNEQAHNMEGSVLGAVLGLSLFVLFLWAVNQGTKK